MAQTFLADPEHARFGCLMVNTPGELGSGDASSALAEAYRDGFRGAFGPALSQAAARGEVDAARVAPRAGLLTAMTMDLFISARIDPMDAADLCQNVTAEVTTWQLAIR